MYKLLAVSFGAGDDILCVKKEGRDIVVALQGSETIGAHIRVWQENCEYGFNLSRARSFEVIIEDGDIDVIIHYAKMHTLLENQ